LAEENSLLLGALWALYDAVSVCCVVGGVAAPTNQEPPATATNPLEAERSLPEAQQTAVMSRSLSCRSTPTHNQHRQRPRHWTSRREKRRRRAGSARPLPMTTTVRMLALRNGPSTPRPPPSIRTGTAAAACSRRRRTLSTSPLDQRTRRRLPAEWLLESISCMQHPVRAVVIFD
jgi:hypothetical protein